MINDDVAAEKHESIDWNGTGCAVNITQIDDKDKENKEERKGKEEYNQQQTHIIYELLNPQGYLRLRISLFDSVWQFVVTPNVEANKEKKRERERKTEDWLPSTHSSQI